MAESRCWGQSSQGPCLPQAFQELNSEVTVTVLVSGEDSTLTFLPGDRIGSRAQVHGAAKYIILHGSGGVSTVATNPGGKNCGSMKMRISGGRLPWPDALVGQGGPTDVQSFLGFLWAAGLGDRASREQQNRAGLFHICLALAKVLQGMWLEACTAPLSTGIGWSTPSLGPQELTGGQGASEM